MLAPRIVVRGIWWRIVRGGGDPMLWTLEAADGRWQAAAVVRGFYLADSEDSAWAEWYRHTAELGAPPASRLPRDTWRISVDVTDVADLGTAARLREHGIADLQPTRRQWPATQRIGATYVRAGYRGLLAPSAAHIGGKVLVIFRPDREMAGLTAIAPPNEYNALPALPIGLRT